MKQSHLIPSFCGRAFSKALACFVLGGLLACASSVQAQGDYIGVLVEMQNPEFANRLGMNEEQRSAVEDLIRKRRSGAIGLAAQMRDLEPEERPQLLEKYRRESEELAFAILSEEQKAALEEYRIERLGLLSLAEPKVAETLKLAEWQRDKVESWKDKLDQAGRGDDPEQMRRDAEQSIRQQISDSQFTAWQFLAGTVDEMPESIEVPEPPATAVASAGGMGGGASQNATLPVEDIELELNFNGAPYDEVINWLATQADLSLQNDVVPPGTFNFRDRSRTYTVQEAMDIINGSLLSSGYQLIRSGRILRCYDLEAIPEELDRGVFLREISPVVSPEELGKFGDYEPVTCTFALKRLDPESVKTDVEQMLSILGRADAYPSTGDLMVTDVARKVRAIRDMIARAEETGGSTVQVIELDHITADEVLMAARPLLGLEEGVNTSDDISISTTLFGAKIFARGQAEKVQILRDLVEQMDVMPSDAENTAGKSEVPEIRRHKVGVMDLQLAYEIASQMLAGAVEVRLAKDENAKQLILQARPSEHALIEKMLGTIAEEPDVAFQVIQLENLDTQLAIAAIKKFFNLSDDADEEGAPVIDGDILAQQVWVKGTQAQVAQIQEFLNNLEAIQPKPLWDESVTQVPLTGRAALRAIEQAQQMWEVVGGSKANPIRVIKSDPGSGSLPQRTFAPNKTDKEAYNLRRANALPLYAAQSSLRGPIVSQNRGKAGMFVALPQESSPGDEPEESASSKSNEIVILQSPNGLIISSDDKEALARFNEMMKMVAVPSGSGEPTVVYLKNIKAEAAKELLETVMSGSADSGGGGGSLLGDMAGGVMGGMFGAMLGGGGAGDLIGSGEGWASGDYTITADPRLNALIIKANPTDMMMLEELISIFDQPESPVAIETQGQVRMIPVITKDAAEVVTLVKELYGERIQGASSGGGGGGGRGGGQPNPADIINALRGGGRGGRGGGGSQSQLAEPKIAISAEPANNMLIVVAQPQQIAEIEALVEEIDRYGAADPETVEVTDLGGLKGNLIASGVGRMLGPQATTNVTPAGNNDDNNSRSSGGSSDNGGDASEAQRQAARAAFFERMRQGGGFRPPGGAPGGTSGRGSFFQRGGAPGGTPGGRGSRGGR